MAALSTFERQALVAQIINNMRAEGGWAGETHIQKSLYILQEMLGVPSSYDYVLYKHGPYSFDLHDEIGQMRANMVLDIEPRSPYGPSFCLGPVGETFMRKFSELLQRHQKSIDYIVGSLAKSDVNHLERLATSLYVALENPDWETGRLAREITELKPHISLEVATAALEEVVKLKINAQQSGLEVR